MVFPAAIQRGFMAYEFQKKRRDKFNERVAKIWKNNPKLEILETSVFEQIRSQLNGPTDTATYEGKVYYIHIAPNLDHLVYTNNKRVLHRREVFNVLDEYHELNHDRRTSMYNHFKKICYGITSKMVEAFLETCENCPRKMERPATKNAKSKVFKPKNIVRPAKRNCGLNGLAGPVAVTSAPAGPISVTTASAGPITVPGVPKGRPSPIAAPGAPTVQIGPTTMPSATNGAIAAPTALTGPITVSCVPTRPALAPTLPTAFAPTAPVCAPAAPAPTGSGLARTAPAPIAPAFAPTAPTAPVVSLPATPMGPVPVSDVIVLSDEDEIQVIDANEDQDWFPNYNPPSSQNGGQNPVQQQNGAQNPIQQQNGCQNCIWHQYVNENLNGGQNGNQNPAWQQNPIGQQDQYLNVSQNESDWNGCYNNNEDENWNGHGVDTENVFGSVDNDFNQLEYTQLRQDFLDYCQQAGLLEQFDLYNQHI